MILSLSPCTRPRGGVGVHHFPAAPPDRSLNLLEYKGGRVGRSVDVHTQTVQWWRVQTHESEMSKVIGLDLD